VEGVLNERTETVHKRESTESNPRTVCGVARHLDPAPSRETSVERAVARDGVHKCGRCFDDGNGY
jgi:hypothetical protein